MRNSKLIRGIAAFAAQGLLLMSSAAAAGEVYANQQPPEPKVEHVPGPRDGYFWGQGHWAWSGRSFFWVNGTWVIQRRGMTWVPDHWEAEGERWHFVAAHWEHG